MRTLVAKPKSPVTTLGRAVKRLTGLMVPGRSATRIGFIVDATGSRSETWEQAQRIQAKMFRAVAGLNNLSLRLVHYGGGELTDRFWQNDPRLIAQQMTAVRCRTGLTQIVDALQRFTDGTEHDTAHALILVGDCFEEEMAALAPLAQKLRGAGIRVFSFLEGDDWTAMTAFRQLAELTGGRFAQLGEDLPLADLCAGVALLTTGGPEALARLENHAVERLLLPAPPKRRAIAGSKG